MIKLYYIQVQRVKWSLQKNDNMAEGKFYFTATGFQSDKTVEVTDGFFRILWK